MNEIMNWVTHYNTQIIQVIFSVILILVVFYLYRLFFSATASSGSFEASADLGELNKKISQLLNQQKSGSPGVMGSASASVTNSSVSESSQKTNQAPALSAAQAEEVEQLKAEVAKLRVQLNESEKKVFEMTPAMNAGSGGGANASATEAAFGVSAGGAGDGAEAAQKVQGESNVQVDELNQKIEQLQSRLSEYDIIADDIAELSQLRTENAELKKKLAAAAGGAAPSPAPAASASTPAPAAPASPTEPAEPVEVAKSIEDEAAAAIANSAFTDLNVPEIEKSLMSDFEKSTQKGE